MKRTYMVLFLIIILLSGCSTKSQIPYSRSDFALDTVVTITLFEDNDSVFLDIFQLIDDYENILSRHVPESEVFLINEKASYEPVSISNTTYDIITSSIEYSKLSNGNFDITIGPLMNLWDISQDALERQPPSEKDISSSALLANYNNLILANHSISFKKENMIIDLGGIAKGYITDRIVDLLNEKHIDSAIINLGGNVYVHGSKSDGTPFTVGIQDPDDDRGAILGTIKTINKSVVTSGLYERFFTYENKIYHHIINPFTGYPEDNNLKGISIISNLSLDGDALSTSLFLLGLEEGYKLAQTLDDIEAIFVTKDNLVYTTPGLVKIFILTNDNYTLKKWPD